MNFLAHIYLSGSHPQRQLGGFIADGVKGKQYQTFSKQIREGILLHRHIDYQTDTHPATLKLKRSMSPHFGRYSGILLDILMDYILASDFRTLTASSFRLFRIRFYLTALLHYPTLPKRFKGFIFHFILTDRLGQYARKSGIRQSLEIMIRYRELQIDADKAMQFLDEHEKEIRQVFYELIKEQQTGKGSDFAPTTAPEQES